jgi:LacI family transcriptional regulator
MGVTIKDIAKKSGVGIATVSRVLNGSGPISKTTKEKVFEAVRELNYVPNSNAQNLKLQKSNTILLLAKSILNPFFQELINLIEKQVTLQGYILDIRNVSYEQQEMDIAIYEAHNKCLCGIIIMGGVFGYTEEDFRRISIPCVLLTIKAADTVDENLYSSIIVDDEAESKKAVEYLLSLGHRKIGCIYNTYGNIVTPNSKRLAGYKLALSAYEIPFDPTLVSAVHTSESGFDFGFRMMKILMSRNPDMTAVFAVADIMAVGAAKAVLSSGFRVPDDISIIGFDGIEEAEYYTPSIDTIEQPARQMAQETVHAMIDMIKGEKTSHKIIESTLLKRGSCTKN